MKLSMKALAALCSISLAINTGCDNTTNTSSGESETHPLVDTNSSQGGASIVPALTDESDTATEKTATCSIAFAGANAQISGSGASAAGGKVTVTKSGVYEITGSGSGKIIIDAEKTDEVTLLLCDAALTSTAGSVIECKKAAKLTITVPEGKTASLTDSENYTFSGGETEPDAAVWSKCQTVINGGGKLNVNALYLDGIKCKDGLKICMTGALSVDAKEDGIKGRDYLIVSDGAIEVNCGSDALKSTNSEDASLGYINIRGGALSLNCGNDAVQAETELIIDGGSITAVTGGGSSSVEYKNEQFTHGGFGGKDNRFDFDNMTSASGETSESMKGLKAGAAITINGGSFDIDSADDALHGNTNVTVSGGVFTIKTGDDGLHADEKLIINDGEISIVQCYEGLEGKSIDINGGKITLKAFDDGLNAAGGDNAAAFGFGSPNEEYYVSITGGELVVNADGDGLDSNGTIAMSGGTVTVHGPTSSNNGAIDYESSFAVSGGTLIALGSSGMAQTPSTLSQPCLSVAANVNAGVLLEVRDESGSAVVSVTTEKNCQSLIFSSDKFTAGNTYSVYADGTLLETISAENGVIGSGGSGYGGFGGMGGKPTDGNRPNGGAFPGTPPDGTPPQKPDGFNFGDRANRDGFVQQPLDEA